MNKNKDNKTICSWCGEKDIPVDQLANARGYGFYGKCPKCKKETVVDEVDLTGGEV